MLNIKKIMALSFAALITFTLIPQAVLSLTFNDGGVHTIDYQLYDNIYVYDNVNPPYDSTEFNLLNGGTIEHLATYDNTSLNISGGRALSLAALNNSIINMSGGQVLSDGTGLRDNATMYLSGDGTIDALFMWDNASLIMTGGLIYTYADLRNATIYGGDVACMGGIDLYNATIYGGSFSEHGSFADVNIFGGNFFLDSVILGGDVNIFGGNFSSTQYVSHTIGSGTTTIHGYGFNIPNGTYTASDNIDYITGYLNDGSPFVWDNRYYGSIIQNGGKLTTVPDASVMLLLGSSLMGLLCIKNRRNEGKR